jgi:rare lipoprotein A
MAPTRQHPGDTESGVASWYGAEQGHHTASGERFNPQALTAAHRHLPFGSVVRVTNQLNGRSVELRINDRGPWRHGRIIDVTSAAADILEMKKQGTVPVTIEIIKLGLGRHHTHD